MQPSGELLPGSFPTHPKLCPAGAPDLGRMEVASAAADNAEVRVDVVQLLCRK